MPDLLEMSASDLNRAVYVAIAFVKEDPKLDILAGVTYYMLRQHPDLPTGRIREAINELRGAIDRSSPDRQFDLSPNDSIYMSRILTRLVPGMTDANLRDGAKEYTLAFFDSYRRGVGQFRQVAPIESSNSKFDFRDAVGCCGLPRMPATGLASLHKVRLKGAFRP